MRRNKSLGVLLLILSLSLLLAACGQAKEAENPMNYIGVEDLKESIEDTDEYIVLDVRQTKDFDDEHIMTSYLADQHDANKGGDDEKGIENLKKALTDATGSETGNSDDKYALVCYSGQSYAQKATDLMIEIGISADQIYTVEGGIEAWEKGGDEYKNLLE